jgi:predicted homoserine dehydrogenase-like protein
VQAQTITKAVKAGDIITYDAIEQTTNSVIWELRKLQDMALLTGGL